MNSAAAGEKSDRRRRQGAVHAVPHGEVDVAATSTVERRYRSTDEVIENHRRHAEDDRDDGEEERGRNERRRGRHACRRDGDRRDRIAPEEPRRKSNAVRDGHGRRGDGDARGHGPRDSAGLVAGMEIQVEHRLLGDEPEDERNTRHRGSTRHGGDGDGRPRPIEARDRAQITRPELVVDDADDEEVGGLEDGVGEQQLSTGGGGGRRADAEHSHHQSELTDGSIGEQLLEVVNTEGA